MDRRTFLKGSAAIGAAGMAPQFAAPALAQPAKVLRFVPQANLANFDPIWGRNTSSATPPPSSGTCSTASTRS